MFALDKYVFRSVSVVVLVLGFVHVEAQTYCTLRFPARDTRVCDAIGTLEENVNSAVFETKGNIEVMQGYQQETFTIFDQQVSAVFKEVQATAGDMAGLEEEVNAMKKILTDMLNNPLPTTTSGPQVRSKRASGSSNPVQAALNSANVAFQHNVSDVLLQLQNISKRLENEAKASTTDHAAMLQEISKNNKDLTAVDNLLQTLDASIRQLSPQGPKGGSGVSLTSVTQAYTQLNIDASVAEQVAQRQYDNDQKLLNKMEIDEQNVDAEIKTINATLTQADLDLTNETNQITTLTGAEKFNEDRVDRFINTTNAKLNTWTTALNSADATMAKVGQGILNATVAQNTLTKDLYNYRLQVDGVQSLVTFTKKAQQKQLGDLLSIKLDFIDDLNVLKYAFGIITSVP